MMEDEGFNESFDKLNDIVNFRFNLGEKVKDSSVMRKILKSLPEKFFPKVIVIEKSRDLDVIKVED